MSLDRRQTEIEIGAGQTESRLNRDFIEFLQKWTGPALIIIALVVGSITGWNYLKRQRSAAEATAWEQYNAALDEIRTGGNPAGLVRVAEEQAKYPIVSLLARIAAGDAHRISALRGTQPGKQLNADGMPEKPEDLLTEEQRKDHITQAEKLFAGVADETRGQRGREVIFINAAMGLAAIKESVGEFEAARRIYEEVIPVAQNAKLTVQADLAKSRLDSLAAAQSAPGLMALADIKSRGETIKTEFNLTPEQIQALQAGQSPVISPSGMTQGGQPVPVPTPIPAPIPAPAPAPAPAPEAPKP